MGSHPSTGAEWLGFCPLIPPWPQPALVMRSIMEEGPQGSVVSGMSVEKSLPLAQLVLRGRGHTDLSSELNSVYAF